MAVLVNVAGPTRILVKGASTAQFLGYTIEGVDINTEAFHLNVHGDQHGGDAGPPIDVQYLGQIAHVRCEFSKWDAPVAFELQARTQAVVDDGIVGGKSVHPGVGHEDFHRWLFAPERSLGLRPRLFGGVFG